MLSTGKKYNTAKLNFSLPNIDASVINDSLWSPFEERRETLFFFQLPSLDLGSSSITDKKQYTREKKKRKGATKCRDGWCVGGERKKKRKRRQPIYIKFPNGSFYWKFDGDESYKRNRADLKEKKGRCELKDNAGSRGGLRTTAFTQHRLRKTLLQKVCRAVARTPHTHSNRQQDSHSCALPRSHPTNIQR